MLPTSSGEVTCESAVAELSITMCHARARARLFGQQQDVAAVHAPARDPSGVGDGIRRHGVDARLALPAQHEPGIAMTQPLDVRGGIERQLGAEAARVWRQPQSGPTANELRNGPRTGLRTCTHSPDSGLVRYRPR